MMPQREEYKLVGAGGMQSPVIAKSGRTGVSSASDSSAVTIAQPADGPSLGVAPAGTCTWIALSRKKFRRSAESEPAACRSKWRRRNARENVCAIVALSFITSPSWPAKHKFPFLDLQALALRESGP